MTKTVRAVVKHGHLEPLEKIDLNEGEEVMLTIVKSPTKEDFKAFERAAGGWKGTMDPDALIRNIYRDRLISTRRRPKL